MTVDDLPGREPRALPAKARSWQQSWPRAGFSLLELLITMAIIALLASFMLYACFSAMKLVRKVIQMASG